MSLRLDKKVIIVTGGRSGIGAAIARRMADEGATVVVADRSAPETVIGPGPLAALHADVADPASVQAMVDAVVARHGRLDGLVNSAGIGSYTPFLETSLETFDRVLSVNLRGTFLAGQAAARAMKETGGGSIVNIASVSGVTGNAGRSAYGASKWGVVGLSRGLWRPRSSTRCCPGTRPGNGSIERRSIAMPVPRSWRGPRCSSVPTTRAT
jgi:NAD(P)-dependent dehydrogenase (short-subunit alcohol dehydrogenase family)